MTDFSARPAEFIVEAEEAETAAPHTEKADAPASDCPKLDAVALYGLAGEIVREIEPHTEAHPAPVLFHLLAMFGNAVGRTPHVRVGPSFHHANLYAAIVGPTGTGRKGTSAEWPLRILHDADSSWRSEGGLSTGEGLIGEIADLSKEEVEDEIEPRDRRLFVLETEFGRTLRVGKREANTLFPVIQQLWETGNAAVKTRKNPLRATDAHVSIAVHVAPEVLLERLDALNAAEGFANRFLFCWSRRTKMLPGGGTLTDADLRPLVARLARALDDGHTVYEFKMDEQARAAWSDEYGRFPELPGLMGEVTHRAAPQTLRLALIYALLDGSKGVIRKEHLEAALALWRYSLDSAKFIFGTKTGNLIADRIHAELRAVYPEELSDAEVYTIFHGHVAAIQLETAAAALKSAGLGERTISRDGKGKGTKGGRPTTHWKATGP